MIALSLALTSTLLAAPPQGDVSSFDLALQSAERMLESGGAERAYELIQKAQERDGKDRRAWELRSRCADQLGRRDEMMYALHNAYSLAVAAGAPKEEVDALLAQLIEADPIAADVLDMKRQFIDRLLPIAVAYEEDGRPHSAIRIHKEILALDPELPGSHEAIQRIAHSPDPSLGEEAKPADLLEGISEEWIRKHDAEHSDWGDKATLKGENYVTHTSAGYAVLVRSATAMDQMNAFYRRFFEFGTKEHGGSVPRIELRIFKDRDEYLKRGSSPTEWSGGQFTGGAVETFVTEAGFESSVGTLFHEAAHQFVSLATNASGWLNEGLASFFEGTKILPNGSVQMNLPANHRLFALVARMENGWMQSHDDGIDPSEPSKTPNTAPTFRMVMENRYVWGPPWYAPTWGVVFFLYNYQDPVDGRFIYRRAFKEFFNKSAGRVGEGAVRNFEEVVLANPEPAIKGVKRPPGALEIELPGTIDELNDVWKRWIVRLRDEASGRVEVERPYYQWAQYAMAAENWDAAEDHFEKALLDTPYDVDMLLDFAGFQAKQREDTDRAAKLVRDVLRILESAKEVDEKSVAAAEKLLRRYDPRYKVLQEVYDELWASARNIVQRYQAADLPIMVMDASFRLGTELRVPGLFGYYEEALRRVGHSLQLWQLAYNEKDLRGWLASPASTYEAQGPFVKVAPGQYEEGRFDYEVLGLDEVTTGDYSLEVDLQVDRGTVTFGGVVFGRKSATHFNALIAFPGKEKNDETANTGFVDIASFFGPGDFKTWRHNPVETDPPEGQSTAGNWHTLRLDVAGRLVDAWFDGEYLASQEFPNREILRGGLGLISGLGKMRFRNVRYMARPQQDPAALIERDIKLENIKEETGGSVGGSYLGMVPPWPDVQEWVQETRTGWGDHGNTVQALVMWSTKQNDLIPIHEWLDDLSRRHEDVGIQFISVVSPNDAETISDYLEVNRFPGAVGVDARPETGIGETFETYSIHRFNLPRVILLDLDHTVVWEGDPGFKAGEGWYPGLGSFLDAPLDELVEKRQLLELQPWRVRWTSLAIPALRRGDLEEGLPTLLESRSFQKGVVPEVDDAQRKLTALEGALDALPSTASSLAREGVEPAIEVLVEWAPLMDREIDKKLARSIRSVRDSKNAKGWKDALKQIDRFGRMTKKGQELAKARELLPKLQEIEGRFPRELAEALGAALEEEDVQGVLGVLDSAGNRPSEWLVRIFFGW